MTFKYQSKLLYNNTIITKKLQKKKKSFSYRFFAENSFVSTHNPNYPNQYNSEQNSNSLTKGMLSK